MDNAILSQALLSNDDAMVIALQHLHDKEKHASERKRDDFVSMMPAMSIVRKCSDFKKTICVD